MAQRKRIVEGPEAFTSTPLERLLAPSAPEPRVLGLFHSVAESIPAYQAFLAEHGIDPAGVNNIDDFRSLPLLTKDNYLPRHELPALCRNGELAGCNMIVVLSGSTGGLRQPAGPGPASQLRDQLLIHRVQATGRTRPRPHRAGPDPRPARRSQRSWGAHPLIGVTPLCYRPRIGRSVVAPRCSWGQSGRGERAVAPSIACTHRPPGEPSPPPHAAHHGLAARRGTGSAAGARQPVR